MSSYSTTEGQSMVAQSDASSANRSAIPDLVKIGQIPTNSAISIDTDVLDPVVQSDTFCRFQLQNKGILHSHSKITLRIATDAADSDSFAPLGVGIHSLIDRCRLLVGTQTISEVDDFSHYIGYKSLFMSGEHQKEREQVTSGRGISHGIYYKNGSNSSNAGTSATSASFLGLDLGSERHRALSGDTAPDTGDEILLYPYQKTNASTFGGPEYQVALADLFPFLYTNQLPLYMMKEPVTIELTYSKALSTRLVGPDATRSFPLDLTGTKLIADYQYFPQEMMEQYAQANSTMSFSYVDYRMAKRTVTQTGASGAEVSTGTTIMNLGGAGRICSKVIAMLSLDGQTDDSILGNTHSMGPRRLYSGADAANYNGSLIANIKYNNEFLYPVDIDNSARSFYQVTQAEGMVPFVVREEYSNQGKSMTPSTLEGLVQNSQQKGLSNHLFYQAYHLNRGERVNSRGIEYYFEYNKLYNFSGGATDTYTLRTYIEMLKTATLNDGMMTVELA